MGAGDVAQLVERLFSMHKALGLIPRSHRPCVMSHICNPDTQTQRQRGQKFKVMFSYLASPKLPQAISDPVLNKGDEWWRRSTWSLSPCKRLHAESGLGSTHMLQQACFSLFIFLHGYFADFSLWILHCLSSLTMMVLTEVVTTSTKWLLIKTPDQVSFLIQNLLSWMSVITKGSLVST